MAVTPEDLADSLHIDIDDNEIKTLKNLLLTSEDLIKSSVNYNLSEDEYSQYPLFDAAVTSLATALYYDRTLENGMPKSVIIMITHLQGRLGGK